MIMMKTILNDFKTRICKLKCSIWIGASICLVVFLTISVLYIFNLTKSQDKAVILLGDEKILQYELDYFLEAEKHNVMPLLTQQKTSTEDIDWTEELNGKKAEDVIKTEAVNKVIEFKMVLLKAKQSNTNLSRDEMNQVKHKAEEEKAVGDSGSKKIYYSRFGLHSEKEYLDIKLKEALYEKQKSLICESFGSIPESELVEFYNKNPERYKSKDYDQIFAFIVKEQDEAQVIYNQIKEDRMTFEAAVEKFSEEDITNKHDWKITPDDGRMYYWLINVLNDKKVKEGDISVVEMNQTHYVVQRLGKVKGSVMPYEEVKTQVTLDVMNSKYQKLIEKWKEGYEIKLLN